MTGLRCVVSGRSCGVPNTSPLAGQIEGALECFAAVFTVHHICAQSRDYTPSAPAQVAAQAETVSQQPGEKLERKYESGMTSIKRASLNLDNITSAKFRPTRGTDDLRMRQTGLHPPYIGVWYGDSVIPASGSQTSQQFVSIIVSYAHIVLLLLLRSRRVTLSGPSIGHEQTALLHTRW
ncbi:hypothetical protein K488DRAFT_67703 [Vararia minispora EC-137]|uniref:Uncharacterized protein n=1 Tax=Vararia minispora EC-137 TaxID=1314806 RepID=A0ACB8QXM4_9AGAM|nr:hypothetical protein K488DRAFT_67703 [Vararia minispora EC-137]